MELDVKSNAITQGENIQSNILFKNCNYHYTTLLSTCTALHYYHYITQDIGPKKLKSVGLTAANVPK